MCVLGRLYENLGISVRLYEYFRVFEASLECLYAALWRLWDILERLFMKTWGVLWGYLGVFMKTWGATWYVLVRLYENLGVTWGVIWG